MLFQRVHSGRTGHAPYGERDTAHVLARSRAVTQYLVQQNIKALVVACNTATAAAIDRLRTVYPNLPIIGVEPALKPAVALSKTGRIGVMATRSTLASARFQALLAAHAGVAEFVLQPCDGLADAIERGASLAGATRIIAICARNTVAMSQFCTQAGQIDTLLGADVMLVGTSEDVARQTLRLPHAAAGSIGPKMDRQGRIGSMSGLASLRVGSARPSCSCLKVPLTFRAYWADALKLRLLHLGLECAHLQFLTGPTCGQEGAFGVRS